MYTCSYSGNRLMSPPRDREKLLTLSEVDLVRIQRHIVKYSQLFNSVVWRHGIVSHAVSICRSEPDSAGLLVCTTLNNVAYC